MNTKKTFTKKIHKSFNISQLLHQQFRYGLLMLMTAILLASCGGSGGSDSNVTGYDGKTTAATVDANNKDQIATAATQGSAKTIEQGEGDNLPAGVVISSNGTSENNLGKSIQEANDVVMQVFEKINSNSSYAVGVKQTIQGSCGGSADYDGNQDGSSATITYSDFCEDSSIFNGVAKIETEGDVTIIRYQNFTVKHPDGEVAKIESMTIECDNSGQGSCTIYSDFSGSDGRVYRVENANLSGDASSGYGLEARVYDPDHGYIDIVATDLIADCENSLRFSSGTIEVSDSSGTVLTITFNNCSEATLTLDGNTTLIQQ